MRNIININEGVYTLRPDPALSSKFKRVAVFPADMVNDLKSFLSIVDIGCYLMVPQDGITINGNAYLSYTPSSHTESKRYTMTGEYSKVISYFYHIHQLPTLEGNINADFFLDNDDDNQHFPEANSNCYFSFKFYTQGTLNDTVRLRDIGMVKLDYRDNHTLFWSADRQDYADVKVFQNNELKFSTRVGTDQRVEIPSATVGIGDIRAEVTVWVTSREDRFGDVLGIPVTLGSSFHIIDTPVSISNLSIIDGSTINVDENIAVSWESENQTSFRLEISGKVYEGRYEKSVMIPARTLENRSSSAVLTVFNTVNGVSKSAQVRANFNAVDKTPVIVSLEPDGINQNVDRDITVSWSSKYQDRYVLFLFENNSIVRAYEGTKQYQLVIPANTLKNSNAKLQLTIYNRINGIEKNAVKEARFIAYGTPETPTWASQSNFTTNKPVLSWSATGQVSYKVEVLTLEGVKADESGEVVSATSQYTVKKVLSNKTKYKIRISIKNQYGLWSKWAEKQIYISYTSLAVPQLSLTAEANGSAVVTCQMAPSSNFKHCEVWRKTAFSDWVRIATGMGFRFSWEDTTLASGVEHFYRIWAIDNNDAISESEVKSVTVKLSGCVLSNVEDLSQTVYLGFNVENEFEEVLNVAEIQYLGNNRPSVEYDDTAYVEGSLKFTVTREELERLRFMLRKSKVLLYRDSQGEKLYCKNTSGLKWSHAALDYYDIEFNVTEINYIEKDYHKGTGHLELVYFDGKYFWNDGLDFSGFAWVED